MIYVDSGACTVFTELCSVLGIWENMEMKQTWPSPTQLDTMNLHLRQLLPYVKATLPATAPFPEQGVANFFCTGSESKYFRICSLF